MQLPSISSPGFFATLCRLSGYRTGRHAVRPGNCGEHNRGSVRQAPSSPAAGVLPSSSSSNFATAPRSNHSSAAQVQHVVDQ